MGGQSVPTADACSTYVACVSGKRVDFVASQTFVCQKRFLSC